MKPKRILRVGVLCIQCQRSCNVTIPELTTHYVHESVQVVVHFEDRRYRAHALLHAGAILLLRVHA